MGISSKNSWRNHWGTNGTNRNHHWFGSSLEKEIKIEGASRCAPCASRFVVIVAAALLCYISEMTSNDKNLLATLQVSETELEEALARARHREEQENGHVNQMDYSMYVDEP